MKKKVLILGAMGNLGVQLQKKFCQDFEVISWDREDVDITNRSLILKKVLVVSPDIIINSAAYNAVDKCEENKEEYELAIKLNGDAPGYLGEAALEVDAIFIHYSSDYVFEGNQKSGYKENDMPNPINNYGRSKLAGEESVENLKTKGLKYYIIRTSKLFGPEGMSKMAKPSFFDVMIKLSGEKNEIDVVDGEMSCFTYTPDLALWTKKLLENKKESGLYHFVNEGSATWYESVLELFKICQIKTKVNPVSPVKFLRPAKRPEYSVLENTKFEKMRNYKNALKEYLILKNSDYKKPNLD